MHYKEKTKRGSLIQCLCISESKFYAQDIARQTCTEFAIQVSSKVPNAHFISVYINAIPWQVLHF